MASRPGGALPTGNAGVTPASSTAFFSDPAVRARRERHAAMMDSLKDIYMAKIKPLETQFAFPSFYSSEMSPGDFDSAPLVVLIGQYSVGKTSFIRYLLERDFPGQRVSVEPSTDKFHAITAGRVERTIPGNAAAVDAARPFTGLTKFGTAFLNRFEVAELPSPILDAISFIDTPGILSGEKNRIERGYDVEAVIEWFASRADRILVLFDAHKLDISDELKRVLEALKGHDDKIRIILNKADSIDPQKMLRVYGALMWSLGKVVRSPEVLRVYIGSFWDQPLAEAGASNADLFNAEKADLLADLRSLPRNAAVRRVNELVKRARLVKVHALLCSHLRDQMPYFYGHKEKQARLLARLPQEFSKVQRANGLAVGDFPKPARFSAGATAHDLASFPKLSRRLVEAMDGALARDIPALLATMQEDASGGALDAGMAPVAAGANPFATDDRGGGGGLGGGPDDSGVPWVVDAVEKAKWDNVFVAIGAAGEPPRVSGAAARSTMLESGLPMTTLKAVWDLSDIDADGALDAEEFALAMHLMSSARVHGATSVPDVLPRALVPPSKRPLLF